MKRLVVEGKVSVGFVCLLLSPVCFFFSGGLREPLLAVFISSFYVIGLAGLLIICNSRFVPVAKRMGDVLVGGLFVFVAYGGLEFSYWFVPSLYSVGG